eukprot:CAMPEP_0183391236 /NCGR_PEP_ID=MMETSP0370-20130417/6308_1 /TAXON_ID=268820 /ORGANISM="Peridinium aciculiferum, Strain PAER-2" /LENGTH=202 /DNA_ID=CAMNT_0025570929 /DNA_START=59 /DNA_END=667 /DNA_ORIENTATION=-
MRTLRLGGLQVALAARTWIQVEQQRSAQQRGYKPTLDAEDEQSRELKERLRQHIAFGRDLRASRKQRDSERLLGLVSVGPDELAEELDKVEDPADPKAGCSTCAVCSLELFPSVEESNDLSAVVVTSGGSEGGISQDSSNESRKGRGLVVEDRLPALLPQDLLERLGHEGGDVPGVQDEDGFAEDSARQVHRFRRQHWQQYG